MNILGAKKSREGNKIENLLSYMETETVKPPKVLPNMLRKVMPGFVVATKYSQGKKDLGDPIFGQRRHH